MIKKLVGIAALLLLTVLLTASSPQNNREVVYFNHHDDVVSIQVGEVAIFKWNWINCTYGLSFDWIRATEQSYEVTKDGRPHASISETGDSGQSHWSDPSPTTDEFDGRPTQEWCAFPADSAWRVEWTHPRLYFSAPGTYEVSAHMETTDTLIDGFAYFDPHLDVYEPNVWFDKTVTVIVEK